MDENGALRPGHEALAAGVQEGQASGALTHLQTVMTARGGDAGDPGPVVYVTGTLPWPATSG